MKSNQNAAMILLSISALVLTVILVAVYSGTSQEAYAAAPARAGDYTWVVGQLDANTELLYVVDIASRRLNVYWLNPQARKLDIRAGAGVDLAKVFR